MLIARFKLQVFLLIAGLTGTLAAAETPLKAIPAESAVLVRFKAPAETIEKVAAFVDQLQPDRDPAQPIPAEPTPSWGDLVRTMASSFHQEYGEEADLERDCWLFGLNPFSEGGGVAYVISSKDAAAFAAAVEEKGGREFHTFVYESWVILGSQAEVDAARNCLESDEQSIESRWNDAARAVFDQGDLGAYVNLRKIEMDGGEPLAMLPELLPLDEIGQILEEFPMIQTTKPMRHVFREFADAFVKGVKDTEFVAVSLTIDDEDIRFESYSSITPGSSTAAFLAANPGSEMDAISSLPASSALYLGLQGNQKAFMEWTSRFMKSISDENEPALSKAHEEVLNGFEQLNYGMFALALPMRPIEQGVLRWLTICEVDNPQRARELATQWTALPDRIPDPLGAEKPVLDRTTETYGEFSADVAKTPEGIIVRVGDQDLGKKIESLLFGPDGITNRTVYLKDRILECFGGSKVRTAAAIRRVAEFSRGGLVAEPSFVETRGKLGKKTNLIIMLDVGALAAVSMQLWNAYMDITIAAMMAEEFGPAGNAKVGIILDEGVPDEGVANQDQPDRIPKAEASDQGRSDDPDGQQVEAAEEAAAAEMGVAVELDDISLMKFESQSIDLVDSVRSLIGASVSFEPQAIRVKVVMPRQAVHHAFKAGVTMLKRFEAGEKGVLGVEVEPIKEAVEPAKEEAE